MNEQFLRDTLFPIIRAGMGVSNELPPELIDYKLLVEIASKQDILPIIREGLLAMNIKGDDVDDIRRKSLKDKHSFVQKDYALQRIRACFDKNGIEYVLLKGSVLRDLYPEKWMWTSCDIDVLVKKEKIEQAVTVLQYETDFKYNETLYHDVSFSNPKVHLELHFSIKENMENIDKLLSKAWDYAIAQPGTNQFVFSAEFQIFHVIAHMSYHFVHGGLGIRPYLDLWLLRNNTTYDEATVRKMCEECGILRFYEECCRLSDVWLLNAEPSSVTKSLEQYSLEGGVFGNRKNATLAVLSNKQGIKYYIPRIFIKRKSLEILYPLLKKRPILLPYYQVRRWIDAIINKRNRVKEKIKIVRNSSNQEIKNIQHLFDDVGL